MATHQPIAPKALDSVKMPAKHTVAPRRTRGRYVAATLFISRKNRLITIGCMVALFAILIGVYVWRSQQPTQLSNVTQVVQQVGKLYLLPTNEQPVLATVTNSSKLATPFLKQAQDGDKVLIYIKAKIAIIYRPRVNKIVAVGPVDITPPSQNNSTN